MSNNSNSVSIPVSDNELDDMERMRVRVRRKRKKQGNRVNNELAPRVFKMMLKYWLVVFFLLAVGLLLFEATKIGQNSRLETKSEFAATTTPKLDDSKLETVKESGLDKKPDGNLNRLDPVTRMVNGVRERCLKILPPKELEQLDIPVLEGSPVPEIDVNYISDSDNSLSVDKTSFSRQSMNSTRFNLFTGYQTLEQRENSYKSWWLSTSSRNSLVQVNRTVEVHCGFYSDDGGFKISNEDKTFMRTCTFVVSTCAFGGGDDLYQPIGMSEASLRKVCYVAFWDEVTLSVQESAGRVIGEGGFIGKWRVVVVRDLPFADQRLNGKIPKMLGHRLFPNVKYSIWVDSKSQFRRDPLGVFEALLWRSNSELAISQHGARSSVYDEAGAVVKKHKATPEEVDVQIKQYRHDQFPDDKRFNGHKALAEASVIVREHSPVVNLFMCLWFNEVVRFTSRDQLSFPYVLWRLKVVKKINMFPVCIRKDLVNSMGHISKAKPLNVSRLS
ncbi:probable hexosyltransferase MUCI70 isoform X1 [Cucumis melo]|uniref:Probable hexosyltransferase MUCI70 isoform X1 n=1 Tax=Cucumis melo TaxID=3656 RepID=A0A1S3CRP8_CUCME|nr:probable hexosyltransferase MUCI70 isoform X1 [Cucumis melo]